MNVILVPGFWLGSWAWDHVEPALTAAGHTTVALTLPGLHPDDSDRASVSLADHIDAVIREIDRLTGPVTLVGHSAGGPVCHAAAARRMSRVARVVHVDTWPAAEGRCINDELPQVDGTMPLPDWDVFDEPDLIDLDESVRTTFRARAVPQPARTATEPFTYGNSGRHSIPTTVIACEFTSAQLQEWMKSGAENLAELALMQDVTWLDVPTGHWPMLTRPQELAAVLCDAVAAPGN